MNRAYRGIRSTTQLTICNGSGKAFHPSIHSLFCVGIPAIKRCSLATSPGAWNVQAPLGVVKMETFLQRCKTKGHNSIRVSSRECFTANRCSKDSRADRDQTRFCQRPVRLHKARVLLYRNVAI